MQTLLVTGATGGVGQAVLKAAQGDWKTVAISRQSMSEVDLDPSCRWIQIHSYDAGYLNGLMSDIQPDALIHSVGSTLVGPMASISPEQFLGLLQTNLVCAYAVLQAFIAQLKARRVPGSAVLFSSVVAQIGVAHHEAISAAKAGIDGLVRSSAASSAASGIRINALAPGMTETPLTKPMLTSEASRAAAIKQYPLSGINQPDDLAQSALWLVSPAASRITGQILPVDGGFTAVRPLVR